MSIPETPIDTKNKMTLVVIKRDGTKEPFTAEKIHKPLTLASEGVEGISINEIEIKLYAALSGRKEITSDELHEELIKAIKNCISKEAPNNDIVAGRAVTYQVRKHAYGTYEAPHISIILATGIAAKRYDPAIADYYSVEEWDQINGMIDHTRDSLFRYAGAEQMREKYLVKNRITGKIFESFQIPYILAGAVAFSRYPKETRLYWVREFYEMASQHYISLPTPIMGGVRTKVRQYSSCVVMDSGDTLGAINAADSAATLYVSKRAGLGINVGRNRGLGSDINEGEIKHTGVIPFIKKLTGSVKSCSKGGIRDGAVTFYAPMWHYEFPELVVLKDNSLTEEATCRSADYCFQINKYLLTRLIKGQNITLFSPGEKETPGLYEAFFDRDQSKFAELYEKYEADPSVRKRVFPAAELFNKLAIQRSSTGRIYVMFVDNVNQRSPFKSKIYQSNLCLEIALPTAPLEDIFRGMSDGSEISLCTLAAINWGKVKKPEDFKRPAEVLVRFLDELLDYQDYPLKAAEESTKARRPLGVGVIGFAHFLAKRGMFYHKSSMGLVDQFAEAFAYYLTKASVDLAKEKGACSLSNDTMYSEGWTPNMSRPAYLDELLAHVERMPWDELRAEMKLYGIRNSTLMAGMPSETSSQLSNETNGFEAPRAPVIYKGETGELPIVVPEYEELAASYDWAWQQPNPDGYLDVTSVLQKYFDQGLSLNTNNNPKNYPGGEIGTKEILRQLMYAWKLGHKMVYYNNTLKPGQDDIEEMIGGCDSGGCKI